MYMLYMYITVLKAQSTDGRRDPQHVDCIGSRSMTHTTEPTTSSLIETARHQLTALFSPRLNLWVDILRKMVLLQVELELLRTHSC